MHFDGVALDLPDPATDQFVSGSLADQAERVFKNVSAPPESARSARWRRYLRAMLDDAGKDAPEFDPPDAERLYRNHVETCRRAGAMQIADSLGRTAVLLHWYLAWSAPS